MNANESLEVIQALKKEAVSYQRIILSIVALQMIGAAFNFAADIRRAKEEIQRKVEETKAPSAVGSKENVVLDMLNTGKWRSPC